MTPDAEDDRRIRIALAATVDQDAGQEAHLDCAARLLDAGEAELARLFYRIGMMQRGSSPLALAPQQALARRLGLAAQDGAPGEALPSGSRADMTLSDLAGLLALTPDLAPRIEPPDALLDPSRVVLTAPAPEIPVSVARLIVLIDALHDLLCRPFTRELGEALSAVLEQVHAELLSRAPGDAGSALPGEEGVATADLAARCARDGLRAFMLSRYDLAYAPFGNGRIFHAFANVRDGGLGAYGRNLGRLIEDGEGLRALIALALGSSPALGEVEEDHWCVLLTQSLEGGLLHRVLDELADAGMLHVMWGRLAGILRQEGKRPDRQVLERIRDAGLDFGDLDLALAAQRLDARWWGEDKNEWLALGDIHAYRGDYAEAEAAFATALERDPGNGYAEDRARALQARRYESFVSHGGFGTPDHRKRLRAERRGRDRVRPDLAAQAVALDLGGAADGLAPELAPGRRPEHRLHAGLHLRRLGARHKRHRGETLPSLQGVEAIRGFYVSASPVMSGGVFLDGQRVCGFGLQPSPNTLGGDTYKHVFNAWLDFAPFPAGRYEAELRFEDADGRIDTHRRRVLVEAPATLAERAGSDALAPSPGATQASLEAVINGRPSIVREARRRLFRSLPKAILVLRTDQLGDLVCSIPALRKLRTLFPEATFTGLVSPANEGLARTLPMFDELIVVDFPVDPVEGRRTMPIESQIALRETLRERRFDLAIDLADNSPSRLLTPLSGASFLVGMRDGDYPFLDLGFDVRSRDKLNGSETIPATNKAVALVNWLEVAMSNYGETVRRPDLTPSALETFAVEEGTFAVLHTGAQLKFSQWPYYEELASLILANTHLNVILMTDDQQLAGSLGPQLNDHPRFHLIEGRLPFDELDALLSYCAVFVGNDSGPKHLASLRGSPVVSIHCARNNWNEWGQENTGLIISRRVPCAGCQISTAPDECGKDFACLTNITPQEVFAAAMSLVDPGRVPAGLRA